MKTSKELRREAWDSMSYKLRGTVLFFLAYLCVVVVIFLLLAKIRIPLVGSVIFALVTLPVTYGLYVALLRQLRGNDVKVGWLFQNFNWRVWWTMTLQNIYTMLWGMAPIIAGIVKEYSYAMTPYILEDEPELKGNAAIERSMKMMDGHKWKLFKLDLSFIGWYLLAVPTLGIALPFVVPYHRSARAAFYEELKKQAQNQAELTNQA